MKKLLVVYTSLFLIASPVLSTVIPLIDFDSYTRNCSLIFIGTVKKICVSRISNSIYRKPHIEGTAEIDVREVIKGKISPGKMVVLKITDEVSQYGVDYRKLVNQPRIWLLVSEIQTTLYLA